MNSRCIQPRVPSSRIDFSLVLAKCLKKKEIFSGVEMRGNVVLDVLANFHLEQLQSYCFALDVEGHTLIFCRNIACRIGRVGDTTGEVGDHA